MVVVGGAGMCWGREQEVGKIGKENGGKMREGEGGKETEGR